MWGRKLVKEYEAKMEGNAVYKEIKTYYLVSAKARVQISTILSYLTTIQITEWTGTQEEFLTYFSGQIGWTQGFRSQRLVESA